MEGYQEKEASFVYASLKNLYEVHVPFTDFCTVTARKS